MRTTEQIEVSIEDTNTEIKRIVEFIEFTTRSKIDGDIKRDVVSRLDKELEWLYNIRDDEQTALTQRDLDIAEHHREEHYADNL